MLEGLLRRLGFGRLLEPKRRSRLRVNSADALEWKRLYEDEGLTARQISERTGRNTSTIYKTLKYKLGVSMRPAGPRPGEEMRKQHRRPADPARTAEMVRLRTVEYRTLDQIGDQFGITRERARQILKAAGVDGRKVDEERRHLFAAKYQPKTVKLCKFCGADYMAEGDWLSHQKLTKHSTNPRAVELAERDRLVAADYAAGMKHREIMVKYNCEATAILRAVKRHGIAMRRPGYVRLPRVESRARQASILADLRDGRLTVDEIAHKHQCSDSWVSLVGKAAGIHVTKRAKGKVA